jgi:hypothetical protein
VKLLLDGHLPTALAEALRRAGIEAATLQAWNGGGFLRSPDDVILAAASIEGLVFVTADRRLPLLLRRWIEADRHHGGVIFVHRADTERARVGSVSRRLVALLAELSDIDWTDRIVYLPPR